MNHETARMMMKAYKRLSKYSTIYSMNYDKYKEIMSGYESNLLKGQGMANNCWDVEFANNNKYDKVIQNSLKLTIDDLLTDWVGEGEGVRLNNGEKYYRLD